ncbi:MAG: hypothetical protein K6A65_04645 [Succinivibrionaceae bacterium]|nr:hypothetical protein [Succinivibrionaceae bacterium]
MDRDPGLSNRQVAAMCGVSHSTVGWYRNLMVRQGLSPADILAMGDDGINSALGNPCRKDMTLAEPNWDSVFDYLQRPLPHAKGHRTMRDAWFWRYVVPGIGDPDERRRAMELGHIRHGELPRGLMSLSTFKRRAKEERARRNPRLGKAGRHDGPSVAYAPGKQAMIDASGDLLPWTDYSDTDHFARVLVGVLPHSGLFFMDAEPDITTRSWISFVIFMVKYFDGVPGCIISDNDPALTVHGKAKGARRPNETYRRLCAALGTVPVLTGVRKPRSKALAEQAVGTAQQKAFANDSVILGGDDAIAICCANGRIRARDINELRGMLRAESDRINSMPYSGQDISRRAWFNAHERALLRPLPDELPDWLAGRPRTVRETGYAEFNGNLYYLGRAHSGEMVVPRESDDLSMVEFIRLADGRVLDTYEADREIHPRPRRHMNKRYMTDGERRANRSREELEAEADSLGVAAAAFRSYLAMSFSRELYPESAARRDCNGLLSLLGGLGDNDRRLAACYVESLLEGHDLPDFNTMRHQLLRFIDRMAGAGVPAGGGGNGAQADGGGAPAAPRDGGMSYPEGFFEAKLGAAFGGSAREG